MSELLAVSKDRAERMLQPLIDDDLEMRRVQSQLREKAEAAHSALVSLEKAIYALQEEHTRLVEVGKATLPKTSPSLQLPS